MPTKEEHIAKIQYLGLDGRFLESFLGHWLPLQADGYEVYAMYTGAAGSPYEDRASCVICSRSAEGLHWEKVITPSQDSAAIYLVCSTCDDAYVETAIRQKALGRLLKERNTRPT
ncbi:MAG TPA: hypothetical protein VLA68_00240 [Nitrososphaera sp.]|nr:hypothetical protein [Nitrososphaera sp.]